MMKTQPRQPSHPIIRAMLNISCRTLSSYRDISMFCNTTTQIRWKNNIGRKNRGHIRNAIKQQREQEFLYGLKPVDYSIPPPIFRSPPPPPLKPGLSKYVFPTSLVITFGLTAFFYFNNKNDAYEYWDAMQTGSMLSDFDDEDENFVEDEGEDED